MKIALAVVPAWSIKTAPLGVACIAGALRDAGHKVRIFDLNVRLWNIHRQSADKPANFDMWNYGEFMMWQSEDRFNKEVMPQIQDDFDKFINEVVDFEPEVLGLSLFDTSLHAGRYMGQQMKKRRPETKVIFGGPGANQWNLRINRDFERNALDLAIVGEGEATVVDVVQRIQNRSSFEDCDGVIYSKNNKDLIVNPRRGNMNLNELPLPYFGDFNLKHYMYETLPMMMSRGCVAKCTFCSETRFWNKYRFREAGHIFREFKNDIERYQIYDFAVSDSLVNGNFKVLEELVDLIIADDINIQWSGYARLDRRMTPELLIKLRKSGCTHLSYGLETGSQKVMDLMAKRTNVETCERIIRDTYAVGIEVHLNMVVGFPGELEEDFQDTLDFVERNAPYLYLVNTGETCGIGMDTPLGMEPKKFGIKLKHDGTIDFGLNGEWTTTDGKNTHEIRQARLKRLRELLDSYDHLLWTPYGMDKKVDRSHYTKSMDSLIQEFKERRTDTLVHI